MGHGYNLWIDKTIISCIFEGLFGIYLEIYIWQDYDHDFGAYLAHFKKLYRGINIMV